MPAGIPDPVVAVVLAGLVVFSRPAATVILTTTFLLYFLAFSALISGFSSISAGIRLRKEVSNEGSMILSGVISVLFGALLLARPLVSVLMLVWAAGVFAIISGIVLTVMAFRIRKVAKMST